MSVKMVVYCSHVCTLAYARLLQQMLVSWSLMALSLVSPLNNVCCDNIVINYFTRLQTNSLINSQKSSSF